MSKRKKPVPVDEEKDPLIEAQEGMGVDFDSEETPEVQIRERIDSMVVEPKHYGISDIKVAQLRALFNYKDLSDQSVKELVFPHLIDLHSKGFKSSEISQAFDIPRSTVRNWMNKVKEIIKKKTLEFDATTHVGKLFNLRDSIVKESLAQVAQTEDADIKHKFMNLMLKASDSQFNIANNVGLYDKVSKEISHTVDQSEKDQKDISQDMDIVLSMISNKFKSKGKISEEDS